MPGGVKSVGSAGDEGGVQLSSSETASTGSMFFMEMDGYVNANKETSKKEKDAAIIKTQQVELSQRTNVDTLQITEIRDQESQKFETVEFEMFEKVLVVEDSKFNRKMMAKALSSYAKEVVMAEDGVEAVAAVRKNVANGEEPLYDVIFMDSLMPNMNGIDATKISLRELKFPNPVIAVTGNMLPEDVKEFQDAGVFTVLGKPLELEKLDEVLKGNLNCMK